jgi:hypothetical protein
MFRNANNNSYTYPVARLNHIKGKWYVIVSVPAHLRHLFPNQRDLRRSTGTDDESSAKRKQHALAQEIYDLFDQRQREEQSKHVSVADAFATDAIIGLATVFHQRNIPDLKPTTDYHLLSSLKQSCDIYADQVINAATDDELEMLELLNGIIEANQQGGLSGGSIELAADSISEGVPYTLEQKVSAARYRTEAVYNYWADLLILAAREQGLSEPSFDPFVRGPYDSVVFSDGQILSDLPLGQAIPTQTFRPLSRPARVIPTEARTCSSVMPEYLEQVERDTPLEDTKRKKVRWAKQFLNVMGDLEISAIKPKHAYDYLDKVLAENPKRSNKTLKDYIWGVQDLLKYCVQRDYIQSNPFVT